MTSPIASANQERGSAVTALISVVAALLLIGLVIAAFYYFDTPPPTSLGRVLSVDVYPIHNQTQGNVITHGVSAQSETYNEVIVLANIQLQNKAKVPIHLFDVVGYLYRPGDDIMRNSAAGKKDFEDVFLAYPDFKSKEGKRLSIGSVLQPGEQVEGQVVFHYPISLKQWQGRSKLHIVAEWQHQNNLILRLNGSQTATGWQR